MTHDRTIPIASPLVGEVEIEAIAEVVRSGILAQGPQVRSFENDFATFTGAQHAIAVNSGTAALHIALLACGIGPGDEVITTPFTFIATANAILFCGAKPVFADIEEETLNIDPALIEKSITPRTRAVVPVHLYGHPCEMRPIVETCENHGLRLVEDACQAVGAEYRGQKVGTFGVGCFSFYPTKNMTTGEGGMITTDDPDVAKRARVMRDHGQERRYRHEILGYNYRMTDIAAAIGICQLSRLDEFNNRRSAHAAYLTKSLSGVRGITTPPIRFDSRHVFHQYTIRVGVGFPLTRDGLSSKLAEAGIQTGIHYPIPIHQQPYYVQRGYVDSLPVSERLAQEVLSLPVHPSLTRDDLDRIAHEVRAV